MLVRDINPCCFYFIRDGTCLETVLDHGADVYGMRPKVQF